MLLAIDIGNTNIVIGLFKGKELFKYWRISTQKQNTVDEYRMAIKGLFAESKISRDNIKGIIIANVVPRVLFIFKQALSGLFDLEPLVLGEDVKTPIENLYHEPAQVGQDRLVNAISAYKTYGGPIIVVDFGTAITFDLVSKEGAYCGGIIAPGIEISLKALSNEAALLPKVELDKPKTLLGKNTVESIKSGILYGFSSLCDGVVDKLREEFGKDIPVIATGGQAELIAAYCKTIDKINPRLTLEGLRIIYQELR